MVINGPIILNHLERDFSKSGTTVSPDTINGDTDDQQTCDPFLTGPDKMYNVTSYSLRCLYYCDAGSLQESRGACMAGDWSSGGTTVKTPFLLFSTQLTDPIAAGILEPKIIYFCDVLVQTQKHSKYFSFIFFQVSPLSNTTSLICATSHLTSFGGSFAVPPNRIDLSNSAFTKLNENPLVFSVMVSCMCLYLVLLIWAKRADKEDEIKVMKVAFLHSLVV